MTNTTPKKTKHGFVDKVLGRRKSIPRSSSVIRMQNELRCELFPKNSSYSTKESTSFTQSLRDKSSKTRELIRCNSCQLVIEHDEVVSNNVIYSLDRYWHRDHFTCFRCNAQIGENDLDFRVNPTVANTPICLDCYMEENHPKCAICKKVLRERCVQALGEKYHKSCFTCDRCHCPFADSEFYMLGKKKYDIDCWNLKKHGKLFSK